LIDDRIYVIADIATNGSGSAGLATVLADLGFTQ